jgi:hypothetical protein
MRAGDARYQLKKLKRRYLIFRSIEICFVSIGIALLVLAVGYSFSLEAITRISIATLIVLVVFIAMIWRYRIYNFSDQFLASYLNKRYPQMNDSADLLLLDDADLSPLLQLQKQRTAEAFNSILPDIRIPQRIIQSIGVFLVCSIVAFALSSLKIKSAENWDNKSLREIRPDKNPEAVFVKSMSITVTPPAYTELKSFVSSDYNLAFPEGSAVKWSVQFSDRPEYSRLFFSGKDSANLVFQNGNEFTIQRVLKESGFYQLQWKDSLKTYRSDFYHLESTKDLAPKISIKNIGQFTKLKFADRLNVELNADLSDDYGLSGAQIVATVSKGSGEGIKFREEKLQFSTPQKIQGKQANASRVLDLKKLGLDPGDEIYFYVEAWDNKSPLPNRNRTETFFIALQDTTTQSVTEDSGLGVDLMPEYFRSQRQIIIDTEKLLKDKKRISKQLFNSTSNELGYDQKVLRLRYGQFLGEEDETGIGVQQPQHDDDEKDQDVLKLYGHQHDTKNEHNLVEQKKHDHANENQDEDKKDDPLKDFVHNHDNSEEATFFYQSLKTKLKAALSQMWDAELYLRLYQPEKSLPYQYKALNLLKEISQDSRIFVHRSGFDPPPLKEEKRLTADLSEVKSSTGKHKSEDEKKYPGIREALKVVEHMILKNSTTVSDDQEKIFTKSAQELSGLAIEQPVIFLNGLSILKSLTDHQPITALQLEQLRKILWRAVPIEKSSPSRQRVTSHSLNEKFLNSLDQQMHE